MRVDVAGGSNIAVAHPFLYLLHLDFVLHEEARACVSEVVEADVTQSVLFKQPREMFRYIIRSQDATLLIHANVAEPFLAVGLFE